MLILGLLLLLAAGALTAGMLLGNTGGTTAVQLYGQEVTTFSIGELFAIGVATGVIGGLSLALVLSGMRRASRKRRERRLEVKHKRAREQELQEENARLARELEQQRRASAGTGSGGTSPTTPMPAVGGSGAGDRGTTSASGTGFGSGSTGGGGFGSVGTGSSDRPSGPPAEAGQQPANTPQEGRRPLS